MVTAPSRFGVGVAGLISGTSWGLGQACPTTLGPPPPLPCMYWCACSLPWSPSTVSGHRAPMTPAPPAQAPWLSLTDPLQANASSPLKAPSLGPPGEQDRRIEDIMERRREAARRSRRRKTLYIHSLESELEELRREVAQLREERTAFLAGAKRKSPEGGDAEAQARLASDAAATVLPH